MKRGVEEGDRADVNETVMEGGKGVQIVNYLRWGDVDVLGVCQ